MFVSQHLIRQRCTILLAHSCRPSDPDDSHGVGRCKKQVWLSSSTASQL